MKQFFKKVNVVLVGTNILLAIVLFALLFVLWKSTPLYAKELPGTKKFPTKEVAISMKESIPNITYNSNILLPKKHQDYLYELCLKRGLDYKKTIALMEHESQFQHDVISSTNDYGLFQINIVNHQYLSEKLGTRNEPLDPYININWGTYLLAKLYNYWAEQGIKGEELDVYVWSSYNKGIQGFKKTGPATEYVDNIRTILDRSEG